MKNKELTYRAEGMAYALNIAKERGIDGLEEEIKYRNATGIPISIKQKEAEAFVEETKQNCLDTVLIMSLNVLCDEFDFTEEQLNQFKARFEKKTQALLDGYINWEDLQNVLMEEMNVQTEIKNKSMFEEMCK